MLQIFYALSCGRRLFWVTCFVNNSWSVHTFSSQNGRNLQFVGVAAGFADWIHRCEFWVLVQSSSLNQLNKCQWPWKLCGFIYLSVSRYFHCRVQAPANMQGSSSVVLFLWCTWSCFLITLSSFVSLRSWWMCAPWSWVSSSFEKVSGESYWNKLWLYCTYAQGTLRAAKGFC